MTEKTKSARIGPCLSGLSFAGVSLRHSLAPCVIECALIALGPDLFVY
jgi:hypothetical protein